MSIQHNSDFLFIFEAIQCNPNGDPDQENKPRMDYDTQTNLVTDVRIKRYIRDFLKQAGHDIFVDLESEAKVTMDDKLRAILMKLWPDDAKMKALIDNDQLFLAYQSLKKNTAEETIKDLVNKKAANKDVNKAILSGLVKKMFVDIRMFGSAFAVDGFNNSYTGPIQLNWGYSLNKVHLMESDTISSIMNDGNSTFGKDYRVKYSLLAFHGSINRSAAITTGLADADVIDFREAIWQSLSANPTRTKLNQYPKLYLEVVYNDGYYNGHFGDLRNLVKVKEVAGKTSQEVRNLDDLDLDFSRLISILNENKGAGKAIKQVIIKHSSELENIGL